MYDFGLHGYVQGTEHRVRRSKWAEKNRLATPLGWWKINGDDQSFPSSIYPISSLTMYSKYLRLDTISLARAEWAGR